MLARPGRRDPALRGQLAEPVGDFRIGQPVLRKALLGRILGLDPAPDLHAEVLVAHRVPVTVLGTLLGVILGHRLLLPRLYSEPNLGPGRGSRPGPRIRPSSPGAAPRLQL